MRIRVLHSRYQRGGGWTGHEIRVTPIVSVIFEKPVSVDEAVNRIWRIKGFFDQLSLCDLRIKAISFSKFKKGWPRAEVYLPNEHRKTAKRLLDVHPTNVPFSRWAERKKFQACLLRWLAHSEERRFFRSALRLSLVRLQTEIDPTLITLLMAGVESLAGLGGRSGISPETVKKMADAVHRIDPTIDYASIKGLLGSLGRTSPKQRLRKIADRSFVSAVDRDIEDFTSSSVKLRNQIAHGRGLDQFERAAAGDLTQALTYLCVAYDLQTSGIPPREEDTEKRGFLALSRMAWAWQGYKMALAKEVSLDG